MNCSETGRAEVGSPSRSLTSVCPGFIQNYFRSSRLHHLSTWKADLCDFTIRTLRCIEPSSKRIRLPSRKDEPLRTIIHVDMDCFYVSVGLRNRPHLRGRPVAVAHSQDGLSLDFSTSEIASCNYEARAQGVRNGMFIGSAKKVAPNLQIIPYEFSKYDECTKAFYSVLFDEADYVQAVSCDEVYADITFRVQSALRQQNHSSDNMEDEWTTYDETRQRIALEIARAIKQRIHAQTGGCNASIGIGSNMLLSRIATQKAKPDGIFFVGNGQDTLNLLRHLQICELPGIGGTISQKCEALYLRTCQDLQKTNLLTLQQAFGEKTGSMLHAYSHGEDERILENKPRQTVGSEINWGVRFSNDEQVRIFLREFSGEVFSRLQKIGGAARHITVNVKKRLYEGEPGKFLGCGHCQDFSKSVMLTNDISDEEMLYDHVQSLYRQIGLQPTDVRGIGIHLKKLHYDISGYDAAQERVLRGQQQSIAKFIVTERSPLSTYPQIEGTKRGDHLVESKVSSVEDDLERCRSNIGSNSNAHDSDHFESVDRGNKRSAETGTFDASSGHLPPTALTHPIECTQHSLNSGKITVSSGTVQKRDRGGTESNSLRNWLQGACKFDKHDKNCAHALPVPASGLDVDWDILNSLPDDVRREQMVLLKIHPPYAHRTTGPKKKRKR